MDRLESFGSYITNPYHLMTHPETFVLCIRVLTLAQKKSRSRPMRA